MFTVSDSLEDDTRLWENLRDVLTGGQGTRERQRVAREGSKRVRGTI